MLIPGELCRGRAGAGDQLGAAEPHPGGIACQQVVPALVHPVPFLLGDGAAVCAEVLPFGRSRALSPRPSKFEQLEAHTRRVQPKCCNRVFNIKFLCPVQKAVSRQNSGVYHPHLH